MNNIAIERTFNVGAEAVFNAFSRPDILSQWIAPDESIAVQIINFNFHIEGSYRYQFTLPNRELGFVFGNFTQIEAPRQLSFTWAWEKPDPHAGIESFVHVSIEPSPAGCVLKLTHEKLDAMDMPSRHAAGWEGAFNRLTDYFNTKRIDK